MFWWYPNIQSTLSEHFIRYLFDLFFRLIGLLLLQPIHFCLLRDALLHATVIASGYLHYCHLPASSLTTVVHENPRRSAVSEILKPPCLTPTIIPRSKSLRSHLFPILTFGLKNSWTSWPHLRCFYAFSCCHMIVWLNIALTSWCTGLTNKVLTECMCVVLKNLLAFAKYICKYSYFYHYVLNHLLWNLHLGCQIMYWLLLLVLIPIS